MGAGACTLYCLHQQIQKFSMGGGTKWQTHFLRRNTVAAGSPHTVKCPVSAKSKGGGTPGEPPKSASGLQQVYLLLIMRNYFSTFLGWYEAGRQSCVAQGTGEWLEDWMTHWQSALCCWSPHLLRHCKIITNFTKHVVRSQNMHFSRRDLFHIKTVLIFREHKLEQYLYDIREKNMM